MYVPYMVKQNEDIVLSLFPSFSLFIKYSVFIYM